ncbi:MAG: GNAT family N-acetyltransferase [Desulfarculus sp.]|nr:GNAT family N-acetyltransferase [Desulfarculus sp.]
MEHAPSIGLATPADIPGLCDLLALLFSQEAEFAPDRAASERGLAAIIADPARGHVLVARHNAQPLGMISILYGISTALGGPVATLEDLVVAPGARGAGLGTRLMEHAIAHARAQGCLRLTLLTDGDNVDAQRLYKREGFVVSGMVVMRKMLGE